MQHEKRTSYLWLDAARCAAAYAVVLSHSTQLVVDKSTLHGLPHRLLYLATDLGFEAVIFFFLLSGFWICRSVTRSGSSFVWTDYLAARLGRLWIVLLPALVSGLILDRIGMTFFPGALYSGLQGAISVKSPIADHSNASVFVCNLLFLQTFACETFGSNGPLWSLAHEFWFYLAFPALWLAIVHKRFSPLIVFPVLLAVLNPGLATGFAVWLIGGAVQWADQREFVPDKLARRLLLPSFAFVCLCLILSRITDLGWHFQVLILGIGFAQLILLFLAANIPFPKHLELVAKYGAASSFSLYATHFPLLLLLSALVVNDVQLPASFTTWLLVAALTVPPVAYASVFSMVTERKTAVLKELLQNIFRKPTTN